MNVDLSQWDDNKQRTLKNKAINEELSFIENKLLEIKRDLQYSGKVITAKLIKEIYTGSGLVETYLLAYFKEHINKLNQLKQDYSRGTIGNYRATLHHLERFLQTLKKTDIPLRELDYRFVTDFDHFLMTTQNPIDFRKLGRNAVNKNHQRLKFVLGKAIREELIDKSPYRDFTMKNTKTSRDFLTQEELNALFAHSLGGNKSLERVRDIFTFSIYTGLRYGDAINLKASQVSKDSNGRYSIYVKQEKTDESIRIPLLNKAIEIFNKYDNEERKISGFVLPKISIQKLNVYLKTIAELCGIEKNPTHHVARHTFATTITLSNDLPIEAVSKLLGYTNILTTQIYAKITNKYLDNVIDKLESKLNTV